jgi:hypothetical protein
MSVSDVEIVIDDEVTVRAPYNNHFVYAAKKLGGRWDSESWRFDRRDADAVKKLCLEWYGTDGTITDQCTLRVTYDEMVATRNETISICGRSIVRSTENVDTHWCDGVICLGGGFGGEIRGGKYDKIYIVSGTVLLVRDFPRGKAGALAAKAPQKYSIDTEPTDEESLNCERQRLVARLAEIEALLAEAHAH